LKAALARARSRGVAIRFADLGEWGAHALRAEYDAAIPEIRLNLRVAASLSLTQLEEFVVLAIGHELYHHAEAVGEIPLLHDRAARECSADEFARALSGGAP
jgi:hypothetical protein